MYAWEEEQIRTWLKDAMPVGTRVRMARVWTKNPHNHRRRGIVVGHQRKYIGPIVRHYGQKTKHGYHWTFVVPEVDPEVAR